MTIKIIPLSELTGIYPDFNEELFDHVARNFPEYVKNTDKSWLFNNKLTMRSDPFMQKIHFLNVFLHMSRQHCDLVQITKNKQYDNNTNANT